MRERFGGVVPRGVVAGFLGATAMAFWFLIIDGSQGEPFRTPAFLAGAILGTGDIDRSLGPVFLYTLIHYVAFMTVGILVSWTLSKIYTAPSVFLGLVAAMYFMHLRYEPRRLWVLAASPLPLAVILVLAVITEF